ncbi:response regulator transcription factor [Pedobacter sp. HDW13]|nr:response regulator transcription factor [Pedobacter sp. HDW13]RQO65122.1 DNA-binding response regulator [Pedobacter sp. KBW01]
MTFHMKVNIGLVDDHLIFLESLAFMLESFKDYNICVKATNGEDLQRKMKGLDNSPDMMLIDVNMPVMDGIATAKWMRENHPVTKLVALSMNNTDQAIIEMLRAGCCSYLLKDTHPNVFETALAAINKSGEFSGDISHHKLKALISYKEEKKEVFSEREIVFLELACSDMTYKEIAAKMFLSERTIDGYREKLFEKLQVQSRVGMALEAIRRNIVQLKKT